MPDIHPTQLRSAGVPRRAAGFTLVELMVTIVVIGLIAAMVAPNLGALVPKARIDAAAKVLVGNIEFLRSEARITGKRVTLELDLDNARWRYVLPPEQQLTSDQDVNTLEDQYLDWTDLEEDVKFVAAGNSVQGMTERGTFPMVFDENGFTSDQCVVLQLASEPDMTWTVQIHGLTGRCEIVRDEEGNQHLLVETGEGAF